MPANATPFLWFEDEAHHLSPFPRVVNGCLSF